MMLLTFSWKGSAQHLPVSIWPPAPVCHRYGWQHRWHVNQSSSPGWSTAGGTCDVTGKNPLASAAETEAAAIQSMLMRQCWAIITSILLLAEGVKLVIAKWFHGHSKFYFLSPRKYTVPQWPSRFPTSCNMQGTGRAQGGSLCQEVPGWVRLWRTEGATKTRQRWRDDKAHQLHSEIKRHPRLNQPGQPSCQIIIDGYWNPSNL